MSDTPPAIGAPKTALWVKIVLGLSLALNLAVLGTVAGFVFRGGPDQRQSAAMNAGVPYIAALPRDERGRLIRAVRRADGLPDRSDRRAAYAEMMRILRAEDYDREAAAQVLARHASASETMRDALYNAWLTRVGQMSDAERAIYADRIEDHLQRRGKKDRK